MVSTRSPGSIIFERAFSMVVLPAPVPPEMTILNRDAPAIFNAVHIFWFLAPHWARLSSVIGLAANLRMQLTVPRRLSRRTIPFPLLQYSQQAPARGAVCSPPPP